MINEILFVHHSHTDVGYTHPQPVVMELHRRFIDEALDIAEATADYPDDARFRWTCEVTGVTMDWWEHAANTDRDRFLAAIGRGQFDVAGMGWHMTPLMDHSMILDLLKPLTFFRNLGIPINSAMSTDINGLPWGVVDALLDHGITGISMAINEHYGHALAPWPRSFNWQAPGGRVITAYNGFIYGVTSDRSLMVPADIEQARHRVPKWTKRWQDDGYPHPFLMMQITSQRYHDNGAPQADLPDFVVRFNEANASEGGVKLRIGTISEFFSRIRQQPADTMPTMRGDWTDWWNFGAGSTAHETAQALRGQRDLAEATGLDAWYPSERPRRRSMLHDVARKKLALYAEHTWGADRSISQPLSAETRTQQLLKLATAAEGASVARMLRRDGLERLAIDAGGHEPTVLLHNPHGFAVNQSVRLPYLPPMGGATGIVQGTGHDDLIPTGPTSHRIQRQDLVMSDLPDDRAYWIAPVEVPPLSYVTIPAAKVQIAETRGLSARDGVLSNGRISIFVDRQSGGITSLKLDGLEYAGIATEHLNFGVPVLELVGSGRRVDMFGGFDVESPDWSKAWQKDWPALRHSGSVTGVAERVDRGSAQIVVTFDLPSEDKVEVIYRLVGNEPVLQIEAVVSKHPVAAPHALYLPLPTALSDDWVAHYETGGAVVKLDEEQLPYASRHYITAQRFVRISDRDNELTVACPDTPLWQIGGYTFGRFRDPDGRVARERPALIAWLTNNYWSTNFKADQGGQTRFRFAIVPSSRRDLGASAQAALAYAQPLAAHIYAERGPIRRTTASLLQLDLGTALLTRIEQHGLGVALTILNPGNEPIEAKVGPGTLKPTRATLTSLSGAEIQPLPVKAGATAFSVAPRAWMRIALA